MRLLTHILKQTCYLVTTTINDYGEETYSNKTATLCRFREITGINRSPNAEQIDCDAILWLEPDENIEEGSIIEFDSKYFKVDKLTKARKFGPTTQFLKCLLTRYADFEGVS